MYKYKMIELIKAMRLPEGIMVVLIAYIGFKYTGIKADLFAILILFFIVSVTMLQNNWRDRSHDLGKGKRFAHEKPKLFLSWLVTFWLICSLLLAILFFKNQTETYILFLFAILGLFYPEARRITFLSITLVSLMVGGATLLPLAFGGNFISLLPLFIATTLIMFGRENLHDIADTEVDRGYKKTIPLVLGDRIARIASATALIIGCGFAIFISYYATLGSLFILWGLIGVMKDPRVIVVRKRVDIGLALLVLSLAFV